MKSISELTKKELAVLTENQVDAYIDIELASQNIVKPLNVQIDYPNYVKIGDSLPERDMEVYEVDGYSFNDIETAQKFAIFVGQLAQLKIDYDYHTGESTYYVSGSKFETPSVSVKRIYSEAKYLASKENIKQIKDKESKDKKEKETVIDEVINYDAIDQVRYSVRSKVREAIQFFAQAEKVVSEYQKFFSITNDHQKSLETLFTVYNIQDDEMKKELGLKVEEFKVV